jgi:hypothetical protein
MLDRHAEPLKAASAGAIPISSATPPLLPVANNSPPTIYADLTTEGTSNHYWYGLQSYVGFASWLTALGGTFSRASTATIYSREWFKQPLQAAVVTGGQRAACCGIDRTGCERFGSGSGSGFM